MVTQISISKSSDNKINVSLSYNPAHIAKPKSIKGYRWHPEEKYWSFPDSNGRLKKILKVFEGEEIHIDPTLQASIQPQTKTMISNQDQVKQHVAQELKLRGYSFKTTSYTPLP